MAILSIPKKETEYETASDWETAIDLETYCVETHRIWILLDDIPIAVEVIYTSVSRSSYVENEVSGGYGPSMTFDGEDELSVSGHLFFDDLCYKKSISGFDSSTNLGKFIGAYADQLKVNDRYSINLETDFYCTLAQQRISYEAQDFIKTKCKIEESTDALFE
jgi:hypothetical protein